MGLRKHHYKESITTTKASGGDEIPVELVEIYIQFPLTVIGSHYLTGTDDW